MEYADLHLHSVYSDGTFTPEEIVKRAKKIKLKAISLTDHDTIEGVEEITHYGGKYGIKVIPGVEFSTKSKYGHQHILGYYIDYKSGALKKLLKNLQNKRKERIKKIIKKLNQLKINIKINDIKNIKGTLGRPHIAEIIVKRGYAADISGAFDKYLTYGRPAYVPKHKYTIEEVLDIIKKFKGISVLAHPVQLHYEYDAVNIIHKGIEGIEAYYPEHSLKQVDFYKKLAGAYDLLITGGSDCHGLAKDSILMGKADFPYKYAKKLIDYGENKG